MAGPITRILSAVSGENGVPVAGTAVVSRAVTPPGPLVPVPTQAALRLGLVPRIGAAWSAFTAALFSPLMPQQPNQETQNEGPRQWQYGSGYNINTVPRAAEGLTPFDWMLRIAELYDTLNMAILYRIEEMSSLDWEIVPRDARNPPSQAQISEAKERLERPDGKGNSGRHRFAQWLTAFFWDVLVTDAASIHVNRNLKGEVLSFDLIDGSTIKPLIDGHGRYPEAPLPAFQQILYGRPVWEGSTDELIYAPKNVRPRSAYGRSPVEMMLITINRALRRQGHDLRFYTSSNLPEAIVPAPAEWSQDQIDKMQLWFDTVVGLPENRRKFFFIPSRSGRLNMTQIKPAVNDPEVERFLDQRVFALLGVSPQALGFMNDINRSQGAMQENVELRRRVPYIRFVSGVIADMFFAADLPDCMAQFAGEKPDEDKLAQAQVDDIYLKNGTYSVDDIHRRLGHKSNGQRFLYLATGPVAFPPDSNQVSENEAAATGGDVGEAATADENRDVTLEEPEDTEIEPATTNVERAASFPRMRTPADPLPTHEAMHAELDRWQRQVKRHGTAGRRHPFRCEVVPADIAGAVQDVLIQRRADVPEREWSRLVFTEARRMVDELELL